jgi:multisubunit Na+/H+ antiporter MnhE subunit
MVAPKADRSRWTRRALAFLRFVVLFTREFLVANLRVAWTVLTRRSASLHPNFLTYDTRGLRPFEILLLSYCITLTPGTTVVDVDEDFQALVLHALEADHPGQIREYIDRILKDGILRFTR